MRAARFNNSGLQCLNRHSVKRRDLFHERKRASPRIDLFLDCFYRSAAPAERISPRVKVEESRIHRFQKSTVMHVLLNNNGLHSGFREQSPFESTSGSIGTTRSGK